MKRVFAAVLMFAALPLLAQERDMTATVWYSAVDMQGENDLSSAFDGFETEFEDGKGYGLSVNRFFSPMLSVELSAFSIRNEAALLVNGVEAISLGNVNLMPITLGAQLHLAGRSRIDPYVGGGAALVLARDMFSPDLEAGGIGRLELEDKFTYYANAGIGITIAGGFGIVIDGRYLAYETATHSTTTGIEQDLDLTPLLLSAGLRFRF